ncbi:hypothetical protein [Pedobacter sp. SL55]|uniref:hypothetical protein n=1 Tax=Pedobacter sp. SL55 TaxID=2995161 RepID=UPI00226D66C4|nr:hypothetical protein [Pedobacter sp. SL55]WAC40608.1 hypothetical protein OVA16_18885 [Pedobacter sp. SL55]
MVFKDILKSVFALMAVAIIISACSDSDKPLAVEQKIVETKAPNPFPFYKSIEIKPGYYFEVVSWGKGVDSVGGFLILMSDSTKQNYKSIAVEREGIITDAWNMDLDNDGNPEIYIQTLVRKNVADVNVYEYANEFNKISFPGISTMKGYKGDDKFFVKNGDLFRSVPTVQVDSGKTTTLVKTLKYRLSGNSFSSSEVKPGEE